VSIALSSYFIHFDDIIYRKLSKPLSIFEINLDPTEMEYMPKEANQIKYDIILCGYDRIGYSVLKTLEKMKKKFIVVDFNPDIIRELVKRKINCIYGDISDVNILERLNLKDAEMVVSTIPNLQDNKLLVQEVRKVNKKAALFLTADQIDEALELYNKGADYVILPHFLGGEHISVLLESHNGEVKELIKNKFNHIDELKKRMGLGHNHPSN
ncbi:NAD-binding protein, partial [Candidatus Woesearchaeota archaeon]|nr:NAD-binding protein [Candidatus Woesearchaeota archaeon]